MRFSVETSSRPNASAVLAQCDGFADSQRYRTGFFNSMLQCAAHVSVWSHYRVIFDCIFHAQ